MSAYRLVIAQRVRGILAGLAVLVLPNSLAAQFGELPPGHITRHAFEGVRAEITVNLLVDSSVAATFVPAGLRIPTLQYIATRDTATARYLATRPHRKTAVPSVLGFITLDSFQIGDRPPAREIGAFWTIRVRTVSFEERARGDNWVEGAYWSADGSLVKLEGSEWPSMRYAPVTMEQADDGEWRLSLTLPEGVIRGICRPSGPRQAAEYPLPAYTTYWAAGPEPVAFELYTYYGHYSQGCVANWTSEGQDLLAVALSNSLQDPPPWGMEAVLHDGWHARAARYRRGR